MTQADITRHLQRAWPKIERALEANSAPALKRRPPEYDDHRVFRALLLYVWKGMPVRASLGRGYPMGAVLHRRWRIWRDSGALRAMVEEYAGTLSRADLKLWRVLLDGYDSQVRDHGARNPAMAWLMVNRFWYEAVVVPFLKTGGRTGRG